MINNEDLETIVKQSEPAISLKLQVIERYIHDLKNETVKINMPNDHRNAYLANLAYNQAKNYYVKELKITI